MWQWNGWKIDEVSTWCKMGKLQTSSLSAELVIPVNFIKFELKLFRTISIQNSYYIKALYLSLAFTPKWRSLESHSSPIGWKKWSLVYPDVVTELKRQRGAWLLICISGRIYRYFKAAVKNMKDEISKAGFDQSQIWAKRRFFWFPAHLWCIINHC